MKKPVFLIAEVGQAHEGSLGILHSYIDAVATTGVDAIKFQTHIAEAESSAYEPFRVNFSYEDMTRYDYWKRMSFTAEQWAGIKQHCEEAGIEFISSPFSQAAVDLLEAIGVRRYKVGSGETTNALLLEKLCGIGKPVILSSGMNSFEELDGAVAVLKQRSIDTTVLQCTTQYPTPPEQLGLNVIGELKRRYQNVTVGLSEHSGDLYAGLAGVALGAEVVEFHVTFDKRMFGPDTSSSLTIDRTRDLVQGVRYLERALNNPVDKSNNAKYGELKQIFEKSLAVNKDLPRGHRITFEDLETKKPRGHGIPASTFRDVIGKRLVMDLSRYSFLTEDSLEKK